MANKSNEYIKRFRKRLIKAFGNFCWVCHRQHDRYDFAHIHPTKLSGRGRGRKERMFDVSKNPNKYMIAGKTCHRVFDGKPFDIFTDTLK